MLGDDAEPTIGSVGVELVGVGADTGQRCLEVVTDAAQEIVLGGIELQEPDVLGLHLAEQLGVADGDGHFAGKQLEEVLVGGFPTARRRQSPDEDAEFVAAGLEDRTQVARLTGHAILFRHDGWIAEHERCIDERKGLLRVLAGPRDEVVDAVPRGDVLDGREDPSEFAVAPREVCRQPIVAIRESGELIVADHPDRG